MNPQEFYELVKGTNYGQFIDRLYLRMVDRKSDDDPAEYEIVFAQCVVAYLY